MIGRPQSIYAGQNIEPLSRADVPQRGEGLLARAGGG
jgi:hypothetical protein